MKTTFTIIALLASLSSFAKDYRIDCTYDDAEESKDVKFNLTGTYKVIDENNATLTQRSTIFFLGDSYAFDTDPEKNIVFSKGDNLPNAKYNGKKYKDHFKFLLDWSGVFNNIERADLIISKRPVSVSKDEYGATVEVFTGALNVNYNDHHGDYVQVKCINRYF